MFRWLLGRKLTYTLDPGLTSAIIDETLGGLNYIMKREGVIDSGPSFTVHLEVDYKKPIPSGSTLICTSSITSIEGRKAWVAATVQVIIISHILELAMHMNQSQRPHVSDNRACSLLESFQDCIKQY